MPIYLLLLFFNFSFSDPFVNFRDFEFISFSSYYIQVIFLLLSKYGLYPDSNLGVLLHLQGLPIFQLAYFHILHSYYSSCSIPDEWLRIYKEKTCIPASLNTSTAFIFFIAQCIRFNSFVPLQPSIPSSNRSSFIFCCGIQLSI